MKPKTEAVARFLLLGLAAGVFAAPPTVAPASSKSPALVAADKLYEKKLWQEAERAYAQYARSGNDASQHEAQLKAAVCRVNRGETSRAIPALTQLVNGPSAVRDAPDVVARYPNAQARTWVGDSLLPAIADRSQTAKAPVAPEPMH